jgi:putative tricarboxylic transport membrane protein
MGGAHGMDKKELTFAIALIGLGIVGFGYSISLPAMGAIALSPGLFPGFVTAMMVVLGGVWLSQLIRRTETGGEEKEKEEEKRSFFITISFFLVYLILLVYLHFIVSTMFFLLGSMLFLYKRFYWKIPVISVITAFGVYYVFRYLLNVRLP